MPATTSNTITMTKRIEYCKNTEQNNAAFSLRVNGGFLSLDAYDQQQGPPLPQSSEDAKSRDHASNEAANK